MMSLEGMAVNKFRKPSISRGGAVCYKRSSLLMVNAEKWVAKLEKQGAMISLNFYVLLALSSQLSVFLKLCNMNTLWHFLLCQSCRSIRNVSLGGPHIPFDQKVLSRLAKYDDDVIRGPPFNHCCSHCKKDPVVGMVVCQ